MQQKECQRMVRSTTSGHGIATTLMKLRGYWTRPELSTCQHGWGGAEEAPPLAEELLAAIGCRRSRGHCLSRGAT